MAGRQPTATVRVALWSAEEVGLVGSGHYVAGLGETERRRIVAYLNADVIAARNGIRGIEAASPGDAGSAALAERLAAALGALPNESVDVAGGTDTSSFSSAGIPAGGLISFTVGPKTAEQAAVYGGTADAEPDDCYHRSCDGLANAAPTLMTELTRALAQVAIDLAFGQPVSNDGHPRLSDPTAFSGGATVPPTRADSPAAP
jgi:aminopeptidase Y